MGKNSGGSGTESGGRMSAKAREMAKKYLGDVKNPILKKELAEGLVKFEKEFGINPKVTIHLGNLSEKIGGEVNGFEMVTINKMFDNGKFDISYAQRTLLHELAHTIDKTVLWPKNADFINGEFKLKTENRKFDKKLTAAFKQFKAKYGTTQTKQIGGYAKKSKNEFFAEALSLHMMGVKTIIPHSFTI